MSGIWLASYLSLWVLVLIQTLLFVALLRQVGVLHTRLAPLGGMGVELGPVADSLLGAEFETLDGESLILRSAHPDRWLVVLFVSMDCSLCADVVPAFRALLRGDRELEGLLAIEDDHDVVRWASEHRVNLPVVTSSKRLRELGIPSTPFGTVVDVTGRVRAAALVNSLEQLESLVASAEAERGKSDQRDELAELVGSKEGR